MQSYIFTCSSKYSEIEIGDDTPPELTLVPIQAWTKPTHSIQQTVSTYSLLIVSNDGNKFKQMEEENKWFLNRVNKIEPTSTTIISTEEK